MPAIVPTPPRFSLVAEIGWLARRSTVSPSAMASLFQSRCRDWVVGEPSRERGASWHGCFSLVAEIGWLASVFMAA